MDFAKIPAAAAAAVAAAAMEQQQRILLSRFRTRNGYQYDIIGYKLEGPVVW